MPVRENNRSRPRLGYIDLFTTAKELIRREYWFFFGIAAVAYLIAAFAPLYVCYGPMMCGVYYVFKRKQAGESIEFVDLFRGFDWFLPSLLVTFTKLGVTLALIFLFMLLMFFVMLGIDGMDLHPDEENMTLFAVMVPLYLVLILALLVVEALFLHALPLLVDRGMQAGEAMKASARTCMQHLWGTVAIVFLNGILWGAALLCCVVPFFLVLPITYGVVWLAYRRVFGEPPVARADQPDPLGA